MSDYMIRASEIAEYVYCRRAWWLRRSAGATPANVRELAGGREYHTGHGALVGRSVWGQRLALAILFVALSITVFALLRSL